MGAWRWRQLAVAAALLAPACHPSHRTGILRPGGTTRGPPPAGPANGPGGGDAPVPTPGTPAMGDRPSSNPPAKVPPGDTMQTAPAPLGTIVEPDGVIFRVWAPHADDVAVIGDFNGWNTFANPLTRDTDGVFTGEVRGARPGQKYLYRITHAGQSFNKPDPRALQMVDSLGPSIIYDQNAHGWSTGTFNEPSIRETVLYELHLGMFNVTGPGHGSWWSAMQKLDHLAALGVNMVEVMPAAEFPGDYSAGYNPAAPFAPESSYGAPDDMKAFVDAAHARGIGVMLDVVHNHYGTTDLSMNCFDGECLGAYGIYFYTDGRRDTPWGPRPNFGADEVRRFIVDNALMWLRDYRLDGLRWDSTVNIRAVDEQYNPEGTSLLTAVNRELHAALPYALSIAEDFRGAWDVTDDPDQGGMGFNAQWDADFFHPVADNIIPGNDGGRDVNAVAAAIAHQLSGRPTARVIYTETHDEVSNGRSRVPEMIWPGNAGSYFSRKRSTLGAALVLTSPGIPMLFMGQEFLQDGYFSDSNPLDWSRAGTYGGIVQLYTDLIHLRRNWHDQTAGLQGGGVRVHHVDSQNKVIAFHRWDVHGPGDDVLVIANFSNVAFPSYAFGAPSGGAWQIRFNSDSTRYASDYGSSDGGAETAVPGNQDGYGFSLSVPLPPYGVLILSQ